MNYYKNLEVWKESIDVVTDLYQVTKKFPKEELYSLTSQIKRSAISIPSNIAEGAGRSGNKEFLNFLNIAYGSLCELDTQLVIAIKLGYLGEEEFAGLTKHIDKIKRMTINLKKRIRENENQT